MFIPPPPTHTHITHHALHTCNASNSSLTVKSSGKKFVYSLIRSALTFALLAAYGQGHAITIEETVTASPQRPFSGDVTIQPNIGSGISSENNHIEFTVVPSEQESGNLLVTASFDPAVSVSKDGIVTINSSVNNTFTSGFESTLSVRNNSSINVTAINGGNFVYGQKAVDINQNSEFSLTSYSENYIKGSEIGVKIEYSQSNTSNTIRSNGNNIIIGVAADGINGSAINLVSSNLSVFSDTGTNIFEGGMSSLLGSFNSSANIESSNINTFISHNTTANYNINALYNSKFSITGKRNEIHSGYNGVGSDFSSTITISSKSDSIESSEFSGNFIKAKNYALLAQNQGIINLTSNTYNAIFSEKYGVRAAASGAVSIISTGHENYITSDQYGVYASGSSEVTLTSSGNNFTKGNTAALCGNNSTITLDADNQNQLFGNRGIYAYTSANIELKAKEYNYISADSVGIDSRTNAQINLIETSSNQISSGNLFADKYGTKRAIYAQSQSSVILSASTENSIFGAIHVSGGNSTENQTLVELQSSGTNKIQSYAIIDSAGDLDRDSNEDPESTFKDKSVISALYAEGNDAHIKLIGRNQILTFADSENDKQLERTVWAYDGASIELDGWTLISTDSYEKSPEHLDVAIAAGTAVNLTQEIVNASDTPKSFVTVNYENDGEMMSYIEGDILSAYEGKVNVTPKDGNSGLTVNGNLLAGNKGQLTLNLGKGGVFTGRADSYMDADASSKDHQTFFNPAFSSAIYAGGQLDLDMGEGSTWIVTGQSWVTNLSGQGGTINLVNALDGVEAKTSHALHIQNLSGKHTFVVNLNDSDHSLSDMLYINNVVEGSEEQVIDIDSFEGLENMAHLDRIRFATVNASDSDLYFVTEVLNPDEPQTPETLARASRTQVRDVGFYDVGFRIENEARATDPGMQAEDNFYDGNETSDEFDPHVKPGESFVKDNYGGKDAQNWYLVRDKSGDSTSDGGETILATARATYWNAVEIDRLNKRLGDARHANGGTDGFWVRVRNDRIGTDAGVGDFRSRNYAYQFGYDHTNKEDDGKRLFGAALDYMDGNTTYRDIEGTGATDRFGVTAYMTWLGDDGWYYDVVGKWGVLSNSFRITSDYGVFVDGDYDNHVLGASFEFGRKLTKENSPWFLEPQAQIQHVKVTEASYSTNQGTHVDQDKINSTITRLGFRIGRNFGEKQSGVVYAKADWLKEWHGHQGIMVTDATTGNTAADVSIDNKGNWFDVGFGVQSPITDTTYFFADAEYVFGNDLDNTWNFNAGVRWMFH